jgi:hypothetical protein
VCRRRSQPRPGATPRSPPGHTRATSPRRSQPESSPAVATLRRPFVAPGSGATARLTADSVQWSLSAATNTNSAPRSEHRRRRRDRQWINRNRSRASRTSRIDSARAPAGAVRRSAGTARRSSAVTPRIGPRGPSVPSAASWLGDRIESSAHRRGWRKFSFL